MDALDSYRAVHLRDTIQQNIPDSSFFLCVAFVCAWFIWGWLIMAGSGCMGAVNAQLPSGASKLSLLDGQQGSNELLTGETQVLRFVAAKSTRHGEQDARAYRQARHPLGCNHGAR